MIFTIDINNVSNEARIFITLVATESHVLRLLCEQFKPCQKAYRNQHTQN